MNYIAKKIFVSTAFCLVLLGLAFFGYAANRTRGTYLIQGVPYAGIRGTHGQGYLYTGEHKEERAIGIGSAASALIDVAGYWHLQDNKQPLVLPSQAAAKLSQFDTDISLDDIERYAREIGFKTRDPYAFFGVWTLGLYMDKKHPVPVIVEQDASPDYPDKGKTFRVIIGTTPGAKEFIVHDYINGPAYKISRRDFALLWRQRRFLIIEPADRSVADATPAKFNYDKEYPQDAKFAAIRTLWYIAEEQRNAGNRGEALVFWERVIKHATFKEFAPDFQAYHYNALLFLYLDQKRFQDIINLEPDILVLYAANKDLKKDPSILVILGEAYLGLGDKVKAANYANQALTVYPNHNAAVALLEKTK